MSAQPAAQPWRLYTEAARASHAGAEYRCACGVTTKYPGLCGWAWRWLGSHGPGTPGASDGNAVQGVLCE